MQTMPRLEEWAEGTTRILSNGMTLWASSYKPAKEYSAAIAVKVGAVDDPPDRLGLAHCFEHIPFRGAGRFKSSEEMSAPLEEFAGHCNAATALDHTRFHVTADELVLEHALEVLCSMVPAPHFSGIELERETILREYHQHFNNPSSRSWDIFQEALYVDPSWKQPVLGTEESITSMTADHLRQFHTRWYCPSNMVAAIVGPRETEELLDMLERHLSALFPAAKAPLPAHAQSPNEIVTGTGDRRWGFSEAAALLAARLPADEQLREAMQLFLGMLTAGSSSPLFQELREKRAYCYSPRLAWKDLRGFSLVTFRTLIAEKRAPEFWSDLLSLLSSPQYLTLRRWEWCRNALGAAARHQMFDAENVAVRAVTHLTCFGKVLSRNEVMDHFLKVTLDDVHTFQAEYVQPETCLRLTIRPQA